MFTNLEDQIEIYTDSTFDAKASAQRFFASYGEQEITKRLNDMSKIQQNIESVLKTSVKSQYQSFLQATEEITMVDQEMEDLKHLVSNTQKLMQDVRGNKLSESRAMRNNSLIPNLQFQRAAEELRQELERNQGDKGSSAVDSAIPSWLSKAPDELAEYIVEQQYQKAVAVVLKTRDFIDSLVNSSSATTVPGHKAVVEKAQDILRQVNSRATHLAATIKKSLLNLPNSQLWGMTEQYKRLKLLISLSEYSLAAEGFASIKSSNMNLAVQSVETSTDILYYSRELSKSFFHELYQCIALYHSLFYSGAVLGNTANAASASGGSHSPKPISSKRGRANSMISISNTLQAGNALINSNVSHNNEIQMLLVQWTQSQVSLYVQALYKQALLVVNESAGLWIIHLRDLSQYFVLHHGIQSNTALFGIAAGGNSLPTSPASLSVNTAMDPSFELDRDNSSSRDFGDVMPRPSLSPQRANSSRAGGGRPRRQSILIPQASTVLSPGSIGLTTGSSSTANSVPTSSSSSSFNPLLAAQDNNPVYLALINNQPLGGLHLLSKVIGTAFEHAHEYMEKQQIFSNRLGSGGSGPAAASSSGSMLPMMSFLGFYLLPEINKLVAIYMEEFIREISNQVRQETWQMIRATKMTVKDVQVREITYEDSTVASSYLWMIAAMNHLFDEINVVLDGESSTVRYYLRTDLCELEPVAASSILRLLLRFVVEMENIEITSLAKAQQQAFCKTTKAISNFLIPSVQRSLDASFLSERLQLLPTSPSNVFKTMSLRLNRITNEAEKAISMS